jgi:hypothetical protein
MLLVVDPWHWLTEDGPFLVAFGAAVVDLARSCAGAARTAAACRKPEPKGKMARPMPLERANCSDEAT